MMGCGDIDECWTLDWSTCPTGDCVNLPGSWYCVGKCEEFYDHPPCASFKGYYCENRLEGHECKKGMYNDDYYYRHGDDGFLGDDWVPSDGAE
jgi:Calcium-binding EGF domain